MLKIAQRPTARRILPGDWLGNGCDQQRWPEWKHRSMAQDGEDVIGVATLCLPWCASRVFFDVFQVSRRSYRHISGTELAGMAAAGTISSAQDCARLAAHASLRRRHTVVLRILAVCMMRRSDCVFDSLDRGHAQRTRVVQHLFTMLGNCSVGLS